MKNDIHFDPTTFDMEDSEDVIGLAKSLVNGQHPGILGTVDAAGRPRLRWMSTLSFEAFPLFHALTAPDSRKVTEIKEHPEVNWLFFNSDMSLVINLQGRAKIISDATELKKIWQKVVDMSHAYFLNEFTRKLGFVAIETTVTSIEINSPKNALRFEVDPSELSHQS